MMPEETRVATTYEFLFSRCSLLLCAIATVVAVDEIIPPIAPEAMIPHFEPIIRESRNPKYSTPAMITTNIQTAYGLKNFSTKTG